MVKPLLHGGDLVQASAVFGHPQSGWLDLSTGINPYSYPIPTLPETAWQQLPYLNPQLLKAAQQYYQCQQLVVTAGSQPVIERLPQILTSIGNQKPALIPSVGYQEHSLAWQQQGEIATYSGLIDDSKGIDQALASGKIGHLLIINPNNPTGICYSPQQINKWAQQLSHQQGFVVVDEAFIDATPEQTCVNQDMPDNLIVLRSFGKFFGLAGIRLGAVIASSHILEKLSTSVGPWAVNGPAQTIAERAFMDLPWTKAMANRLVKEQSQQLQIWHKSLAKLGAQLQADTPLFRSFALPTDLATELHHKAAQAGILIRPIDIGDSTSLLRFGNIDLTQPRPLARCQEWLTSIG
jgi:cobalamin biosynthetic protein CobC